MERNPDDVERPDRPNQEVVREPDAEPEPAEETPEPEPTEPEPDE